MHISPVVRNRNLITAAFFLTTPREHRSRINPAMKMRQEEATSESSGALPPCMHRSHCQQNRCAGNHENQIIGRVSFHLAQAASVHFDSGSKKKSRP
jgi:hypothetical protein